jgi:hypothetical protein
MIDAGTTLVTFMDNQADFATVPYLLAEWGNMYEDKYSEFICVLAVVKKLSVTQLWSQSGLRLRKLLSRYPRIPFLTSLLRFD